MLGISGCGGGGSGGNIDAAVGDASADIDSAIQIDAATDASAGMDAPVDIDAGGPICGILADTFSSTEVTPLADNGTITSDVVVSGVSSHLWLLTLTTEITHTFNNDLVVHLISPAGTRVAITTGNGGGANDIFNGTLWTDAATDPVTDYLFENGTAAPMRAPESALQAFFGEDPNGTWTLEVTDNSVDDTGTLHAWSLDMIVASQVPEVTRAPATSTNTVAITNGTPATDQIVVSGITGLVCDVDITTSIAHTRPQELTVAVTAPGGTRVVLSSNNGGTTVDAFDGVPWSDEANLPVTEHAFSAGAPATTLTPEGALGAFRGLDANGTWTIEITDATAAVDGQLTGWTVDIATCACAGN